MSFIEVCSDEPIEVQEARIAEAVEKSRAAGWYEGCGAVSCIVVELPPVGA